jgi:hypothetical protein
MPILNIREPHHLGLVAGFSHLLLFQALPCDRNDLVKLHARST